MNSILTVNRIELGMKNLKVFQIISIVLIIFSLSLFLFVEDYQIIILAFGFSTMMYFFFKLQDVDKIIFYEDQVHHVYFGKIKKTINYAEIKKLIGIESGLSSYRIYIEKNETKDEDIEIKGKFYTKKMSLEQLSQITGKGITRFIVIGKTDFPQFKWHHRILQKLNTNKNFIILHFYPEVYDFLIQKKLV
jgi:hypothetical protein